MAFSSSGFVGVLTFGDLTFGDFTFEDLAMGDFTFGDFTLGDLAIGDFTFGMSFFGSFMAEHLPVLRFLTCPGLHILTHLFVSNLNSFPGGQILVLGAIILYCIDVIFYAEYNCKQFKGG